MLRFQFISHFIAHSFGKQKRHPNGNIESLEFMKGLSVVFIWLPAHSGVVGNELADRKAKR